MLLFDFGTLGWPETAVHGHADALSVWLHLAGCPVFVDAGTYRYSDTPWRERLRSTSMHNTLSFRGKCQAEYVNRFMWGRKPCAKLLDSQWSEGTAMCQAQVTWWSGELHTRTIDWRPSDHRLLIRDKWNAEDLPEIGFLIAPSCSATINDDGSCRVVGEFGELFVNQPRWSRSDYGIIRVANILQA